jgi:hypothetical protein
LKISFVISCSLLLVVIVVVPPSVVVSCLKKKKKRERKKEKSPLTVSQDLEVKESKGGVENLMVVFFFFYFQKKRDFSCCNIFQSVATSIVPFRSTTSLLSFTDTGLHTA